MTTSKYLLASLLAVLVVAAASCGGQSDTRQSDTNGSGASVPDSTSSAAQADGADQADLAGHVVMTVAEDAVLKQFYSTVDELNKSSYVDAIVEGTVSNVRYEYIDEVTYSILTVQVSQVFKGSVPQTITVWEDGGYVKLKDMLGEFKGHADTSTFTEDQLDGTVDVRFFDAPHSNVGDEVILYLWKNPNKSEAGSYMMVSSVFGRFILDKQTGNFERPTEASMTIEWSVPRSKMEASLSSLQG